MTEMFGDVGQQVERLSEPITGECLCGAVKITVESVAKEVDICHCDMCRKSYGNFAAAIAGHSFTIEGRDNVSTYASSPFAERTFCKTCGSALWYRFVPTDFYSFLAGLFEVPDGFSIKQQIFIEEKPDWYDLVQKSPMKTGAEIIAEAEAAGISFD